MAKRKMYLKKKKKSSIILIYVFIIIHFEENEKGFYKFFSIF